MKDAELILCKTAGAGAAPTQKRFSPKVTLSRILDQPILDPVQGIALLEDLLVDE